MTTPEPDREPTRDLSRDLARDLTGCRAAHARLLESIAALTDDDVRRPSLLPGWTVGHVLTHLARNADSHVRLLEAAARGETTDQYVGGAAGRSADIDAGAGRSTAEILDDVRSSAERLEAAWDATTATGWSGSSRTLRGDLANAQLPYRRWIETEVHHVDLGPLSTGTYAVADMPSDFVGLELRRLTAAWASRKPMGLTTLPNAALALSPADRLAWLLGRLHVDGLPPADVLV